jgi:WD40 repeat protein
MRLPLLALFPTLLHAALPVAELQRNTQVDFAKEIVPVLKQNCFACHNAKKAKADLNLESPQDMITGGDSGPSLVPGKPAESLVFTYAAHLEEDPMPPAKNKSNARNLTPPELALLKLWITQGAQGSSATLTSPTEWSNLNEVRSSYATAITPRARFAAVSRGTRLFVYDLHRGTLDAELIDPALTNSAHRDFVHTLAFNQYQLLASGGYRTLKLWQRHLPPGSKTDTPFPETPPLDPASPPIPLQGLNDPITTITLHQASQRIATGHPGGQTRIWNAQDGKLLLEIKNNPDIVRETKQLEFKRDLARTVHDQAKSKLDNAEKQWTDLSNKIKTDAQALANTGTDLDQKERALHIQQQILDSAQAANRAPAEIKKITDTLASHSKERDAARTQLRNARHTRELTLKDGTAAAHHLLAIQARVAETEAQLLSAEEALKAHQSKAAETKLPPIKALAFSPDGSTLAIASDTAPLRLWNAHNGQDLEILTPPVTPTALAFSNDTTLLARLPDNSVFTFPTTPIWSIKHQWGDHQKATPFPDRILALAFHPNGQQLAAASGIPSRHALIQLLSLDNDTPIATLPKAHLDTITALSYSPDGTRLASASTDRTLKIHHLDPPSLERTLEGHNNHILSLAWSPDASTLASAGADRLYKLWNPETGKETKSQGGFPAELATISFLGQTNQLLTASARDLKANNQNLPGIDDTILSASTTPDGSLILSAGESGTLRIWNAQDQKILHTFPE